MNEEPRINWQLYNQITRLMGFKLCKGEERMLTPEQINRINDKLRISAEYANSIITEFQGATAAYNAKILSHPSLGVMGTN